MRRFAIPALAALVAVSACAGAMTGGNAPSPSASTPTLAGGPWLVEDIDGGGVIDDARVDISFGPGDAGSSRVSGRSGCNRFTGSMTQTGSAIRFGPVAGTRMACPEAAMNLEDRFLKSLAAVTSVRFDATGAAILSGPGAARLTLRRETK